MSRGRSLSFVLFALCVVGTWLAFSKSGFWDGFFFAFCLTGAAVNAVDLVRK